MTNTSSNPSCTCFTCRATRRVEAEARRLRLLLQASRAAAKAAWIEARKPSSAS